MILNRKLFIDNKIIIIFIVCITDSAYKTDLDHHFNEDGMTDVFEMLQHIGFPELCEIFLCKCRYILFYELTYIQYPNNAV